MRLCKITPGSDACFLGGAADEGAPQLDSCIIAMLFVADTHEMPLFVIHQWQIDTVGESAFLELYGCTHIDQRSILQYD